MTLRFLQFFRRRPRNRRHQRPAAPLGVRQRAETRRRFRWRMAFLALMLAALATAGGYFLNRGWSALRTELVFKNPLFALRTIEITIEGHWITAAQVEKWAGVNLGENLLTLDLMRIRSDLTVFPQIESVSIERVLPHLLRIRVIERESVAQLQSVQRTAGTLSPVIFYLDAQGYVMPPWPAESFETAAGRALAALPLIRGVDARELRPGTALSSPTAHAALALIKAFPKSAIARTIDLGSIDVSGGSVLTVTTTQGAVVDLAPRDFDRQLARWHLIENAGQQMARSVGMLDLSVTNNCPVQWVESTELVPRPPRIEKPQRLKRKHV
ncbi:MAG: cell division protein FtsQ/DivIB [Limisphaerales bacterium]